MSIYLIIMSTVTHDHSGFGDKLTLEQLSQVNIVPRFLPLLVAFPELEPGTLCDSGKEVESSLSSTFPGSKVPFVELAGGSIWSDFCAPFTERCDTVGEASDKAANDDSADVVCKDAGLYDKSIDVSAVETNE
jgi:hypothetical protein